MESIEGVVSSVIFTNEENGYTVLRVTMEGDEEITAVGCMPGIAPGEKLSLHGEWTNHPSYGRQFKAAVAERRMPEDSEEIYLYLASGTVRGVGAVTARRLVDTFGDQTLLVMENEPEKLTKIKGITLKRAKTISAEVRSQMGMRLLMDYLTANGLAPQLGMPLYRQYGALALQVLKDNPYVLLSPEIGVEFAIADKLALSGGISADSEVRRRAGVLHVLTRGMEQRGHTFLVRGDLLDEAAGLLSLDRDLVEDMLDRLVDEDELEEEFVAGEDAIYQAEMRQAERYIARRLLAMAQRELHAPEDLDSVIDRLQASQGITYTPLQREAIRTAATRQVMLLTGGPGTGKTTSLRGVLALFDRLGLHTSLAAPTGRAAKRLGDLCDAEASTIHRLLETGYDPRTGKPGFQRDEDNPLPADAVIVDETSMVDVSLMWAFLCALREDCRLILVGDPDQLPSVGPGNLFSDLIRSGVIPTVRLNEVFRQAAESRIIMNAYQVNRGEHPDFRANEKDFFLLSRRDENRALETIVELCQTRLPRKMGIASNQIQVLSPTKKGIVGTVSLNRAIQSAVNPPAEGRAERIFGETVFRTGDRVMQVRNNYDALWKNPDSLESGMGVYNGDIGTIVSVESGSGTVLVDFDGRQVEYPTESLNELELAYAITVHKAQGSEYRAVILSAMPGPYMLQTRCVLYTGITRARELFIAVGEEEVLHHMVDNNRQAARNSGVLWRLTDGAES